MRAGRLETAVGPYSEFANWSSRIGNYRTGRRRFVNVISQPGHLFGFERVSELLRTKVSASAVAAAAQTFGQEAMISVSFP